jgi:hypothetical protein
MWQSPSLEEVHDSSETYYRPCDLKPLHFIPGEVVHILGSPNRWEVQFVHEDRDGDPAYDLFNLTSWEVRQRVKGRSMTPANPVWRKVVVTVRNSSHNMPCFKALDLLGVRRCVNQFLGLPT